MTIRERLFAPIDIAALVYFRITFGALMVWELVGYLGSGRARELWVTPSFQFKYYGFGWVERLPGEGALYLVGALTVVAFFLMLGWFYRIAAWLFFVGFSYLFLLDQAKYMNHFYLICLLALAATALPASRSFSLDVRRQSSKRQETAPAWTLWILRAQMGIVYFYGGIAKINTDWLRAEPIRAWLQGRSDMAVIGDLLAREPTAWFFAYGGLLFDLLVVPFLLWKPTRGWAFLVALIFHLTNSLLFSIGIFPFLGIALTALFFDPSWPRSFARRMASLWDGPSPIKKRASKPPKEQAAPVVSGSHQLVVITVLAVYFTIQILLPFRHFLYSGNVHWTEEGHRFSWHMMLRSKTTRAEFTIHHADSTDAEIVRPLRYLSGRQYLKMIDRPDMLLQFCRHLAEQKRAAGYRKVQVHAEVHASLNGRQEQKLIDPTVDLAAEPRSLRHAEWIVDLEE